MRHFIIGINNSSSFDYEVKDIISVIDEDVIINDRVNMVYSGCNLVHGKIVGVVCFTGMNTELGNIASSITSKKDVPTPLQLRTAPWNG